MMDDNLELISDELYDVVIERALNPVPGSYTNYLLNKGVDKILTRLGEQTLDLIIATKNRSNSDMIMQSADLIYHLIVLLAAREIPLAEVNAELRKRRTLSDPDSN
ncbi:MAG: phosphoribosyl-ATP diphosphatase [Eubacteriales bacterium]|nr:phosphoribosyl-ATP diphosphatase [Eubacteriales bacterium]